MTPDRGGTIAPAVGEAVHDVTWELLGTAFRITCTSDEMGATTAQLFEAFPKVAGGAAPATCYAVIDGCERHGHDRCLHAPTGVVDVSGPPGVALAAVLTAVNEAAIDAFDGLAVHAGVLAAGSSAIAFPAPSGTGKTTLAAAGLVAGFEYVSDEALCIDPATRRPVPYPRALALSPWSRHAVALDHIAGIELGDGEVAITAGQMGARVAAAPPDLAHVVHLEPAPDGNAGGCVLTPAPRADALTWLVQRSFNHYKDPTGSFHLAAALARGAQAWRLDYGDPLEAAALLRDRLG